MTTISIARQPFDLLTLMAKVAHTKKPVKIRGPQNNCVLLSDEEWRGIQETNYLKSIPGVWESIVERGNDPFSEFIREEDFFWKE